MAKKKKNINSKFETINGKRYFKEVPYKWGAKEQAVFDKQYKKMPKTRIREKIKSHERDIEREFHTMRTTRFERFKDLYSSIKLRQKTIEELKKLL